MHKFFTLNDLDVNGKRVLVRVDFNVPLDKKTNEITDDKRIRESLPTIRFLIEKNAKVILCSHLGRPDGKVVESLRLDKVAARLGQLLDKKVEKLDYVTGQIVKEKIKKMSNGEIIMLENVQFEPGETHNLESYARTLAGYCQYFVFDAFGQAHREYASISGIQKFVPSCAGFLIEKELRIMGKAMENPDKPFIGILGGAKISDKIKVIENLLRKVDKLLIGGAMVFTFLKAQGKNIGDSKIENEYVELAKKLLNNKKIILPIDVVIADKFDANADSKIMNTDNMPNSWMGLDIGPKTIENYKEILKNAKTVLWSGPLGVFEFEKFANGTKEIAKFLSSLKATTIVGGGDTAAAVEKFGYAGKLTHVSTGGGASLEFFEGKKLPGIEALEESYKKFKK